MNTKKKSTDGKIKKIGTGSIQNKNPTKTSARKSGGRPTRGGLMDVGMDLWSWGDSDMRAAIAAGYGAMVVGHSLSQAFGWLDEYKKVQGE